MATVAAKRRAIAPMALVENPFRDRGHESKTPRRESPTNPVGKEAFLAQF
jgi:hypothetical protein